MDKNAKQFTMLSSFMVDPRDSRRNNFGVPFNDLKLKDMKEQERKLNHRRDLNLIKEDPKKAIFILAKFSCYVDDDSILYLPAEVGLTAFSVNDGIIGNFCTMIDVYKIPLGHGFTARDNSIKFAVPYPPFDTRLQNYKTLLDRMQMFIKHHTFPAFKTPKVYFMPADMDEAFGCFNWLYEQIEEECPFELYTFPEAMFVLTQAIHTTSGGDRVTLQDRLVRARLARDRHFGDNFERNPRSIAAASVKSSLDSLSGRYSVYPYSESIAKSSKSMRPSEISEEEWIITRAGYFTHERQVQEYLSSFDLAFEKELSCLYHMNSETDLAMHLCPLNITNRMVYNILDTLIFTAEVNPKLNYHIPSIGFDNDSEVKRREQLLKKWVIVIKSNEDFKLLNDHPPTFFIEKPKVVGIPK